MRFVPNVALREITPTAVVVQGIGYDGTQELPADTVVVVSYHQPNVELADHLGEQDFELHLVGDVTGTSSIYDAIHSAAAIARAL